VRQALTEASGPVAPAAVARLFRRAPVKKARNYWKSSPPSAISACGRSGATAL